MWYPNNIIEKNGVNTASDSYFIFIIFTGLRAVVNQMD